MAIEIGKPKEPEQKAVKGKVAGKPPSAPTAKHVSAADEDFEHTLRRLVIEKEKRRAKFFGDYL